MMRKYIQGTEQPQSTEEGGSPLSSFNPISLVDILQTSIMMFFGTWSSLEDRLFRTAL